MDEKVKEEKDMTARPRSDHGAARQTATDQGSVAGWAMVPREPTEAMAKAGADAIVSHAWSAKGEHISDPDTVYRAMIKVAPAQREGR